ncbi:hypothetical protein [Microbaculum marinum]|uniref:Uncharacterized protein n=1 Tax=Microbaculum marinum TaxID=1764581 RepID=A0AAW9RI28_9HYPH
MRILLIALLTLVAGLAVPASAQEGPGSFARWTHFNGGMVRLDANYVASDTCQAAVDAWRGSPSGPAVGDLVIPVTIVIGPNPKGCTDTRVVRRIVSVGATSATELIQIYFVTTSGKILKVEKVAISTY